MSDLVEFLKSRLAEDEQTAREASNRSWLIQDNIIELWPERIDDGFMSWPTRADARHAYNWEPVRVLREVEAKRKMLDTLQHGLGDNDTGWLANLLLEEWATAYANHPDYDPAWRPETVRPEA